MFVILLTTLLVGSHNKNLFILSNRVFVTLGDVSYSVYLIHWPLFTWYRYTTDEEADLQSNNFLKMILMRIENLIFLAGLFKLM